MKGTTLSPGPSLLGGFPKQGLAKEKNQEQASRQQNMHMEMSSGSCEEPSGRYSASLTVHCVCLIFWSRHYLVTLN
jgi:hypothetical protein